MARPFFVIAVLLSLLGLSIGAISAVSAVGAVGAVSANAATATNCTRFVATTGSDSAAGTQAAPWKTVLAAIGKLHAGDVLCVMPGTYTQEVIASPPAGTATAPITIQSYDPANRALLDGRFSLSNLAYWNISQLRFTNPTPTATDIINERIVALIGGHNVVFSHNEIFNGKYAGLLIGRVSPTSSTWPMNYQVLNNYIHDTSAANFYFNPGAVSSGHVIAHNLLVNSGTENLKVGWGDNCDGYTGGVNGYGAGGTAVNYNTMVNAGTAGNLVFAEPGGQHPVTADHNLLLDPNSQRGYHVRYDSTTGCLGDDVTVSNTWARGWLSSNPSGQIPFSEDYGKAPASQARESGTVLGKDPQLDANYVPQNTAAQAYGYTAG